MFAFALVALGVLGIVADGGGTGRSRLPPAEWGWVMAVAGAAILVVVGLTRKPRLPKE